MRTKFTIPFCECGCGQFVTQRPSHKWNRFLPSHNFKIPMSPLIEQKRREKISTTMKNLIANNPEMRESRRSFSGKTHSPEVRKRLSEASFIREQKRRETGYRVPDYIRQKIREANIGKFVSEETKRKISKSNKGKIISKESIERMKISLKKYYITHTHPSKGKQYSEERKQKMSIARKGKYRGSEASNWRGGISSLPYSIEWTPWLKEEIKQRDNSTCQNPRCDYIENVLDVHHINYDKQNNSPDNLITICKRCHGKTQRHRVRWINYYQRIMKSRG